MPDSNRAWDSLGSGDLRHRITFQTYVTTRNEAHEKVKTWSDYRSFWARVDPVSGTAQVIDEALVSQVTHTVVMRHQGKSFVPDPNTMRISFRGRVLSIVDVINVGERNEWYELTCKEVEK